MWGISSAGRALAWHARGQRFDPAILHQKSTVLRRKYGAFRFLFRQKDQWVHRSPCRRASDTPRSQTKPLSVLTPAVFSAPRRQLHAKAGLFLPLLLRRGRSCSNPPLRVKLKMPDKTKNQRNFYAGLFGGAKQPKSEPLPSGASLAAISSKVMVFVPSL